MYRTLLDNVKKKSTVTIPKAERKASIAKRKFQNSKGVRDRKDFLNQ